MLSYLNHRAILKCTHGGQVLLVPPPLRSLHIMGSPVVTDFDLLKAPIIGCPQIGPGLKPCTRCVMVVTGRARDIFVDSLVPLLDTLQALTDGSAPGLVTAVTNGGSNAQPFDRQLSALARAALRKAALCEICGP
jgi:hypothetical protein